MGLPWGQVLDCWSLGRPRPVTWKQCNLCLLIFHWGRGQRSCWISSNAQVAPTAKSFLVQNVGVETWLDYLEVRTRHLDGFKILRYPVCSQDWEALSLTSTCLLKCLRSTVLTSHENSLEIVESQTPHIPPDHSLPVNKSLWRVWN